MVETGRENTSRVDLQEASLYYIILEWIALRILANSCAWSLALLVLIHCIKELLRCVGEAFIECLDFCNARPGLLGLHVYVFFASL
jgi:hypothetical protein